MATKHSIIIEHLHAYLRAEKPKKGRILDHVCFVTGMHRKAIIRAFRRLQLHDPGQQKRRGRSTVYPPAVTAALRQVWEAGNEVCGELLHPMINEYIDILERDGMWDHLPTTTALLRRMSAATVKRRVGKFLRTRQRRNGMTNTKPSHLKYLIPIFLGPWEGTPPGFGQIDTVMHSDSATGDAVYTVNYTDAASLTMIPYAQWNKGQRATRDSMQAIRKRLPVRWQGAHPDTGSEFLNYFVMNWCQEQGIELSRSRPNHKNDNMFVEERNGHVIRKTVGYLTLNCPEAVPALNAVYDALMPYRFHFVAVRRQVSKEKLSSRYRRTYEKKAKTPYQRILEHPAVEASVKERLRQEHMRLNPLILKQEIDQRVHHLYTVQRRFGTPRSENVR